MADRFDSYLRRAAGLVRDGDFARAEGFERLARQTLETLGSPPRLASKLQRVMERLHAARDRYFGNARTARNLFDDVVAHQAERLLAGGGAPERAALVELTLADVRAASAS